MARFIPKFVLGLQKVAGKLSVCSKCKTKIFIRHSSVTSKCKPVKLAYQLFEPKCGSDDRLPPLILLHGIVSFKEETWGDLPQVFADQTKRKVYNLDARNHGDSEWSDELSYDLNAVDFLHFIDEMSLPKTAILGFSMGGITAIKAALRVPERIEMLLVAEMFTKKIPKALMDLGINSIKFWREAENFIPPGLNKEDTDNFITQYIFRKTLPENSTLDSRSKYISYPLEKDSSCRYVFKMNLEVILKKVKNAEAMMVENEGTYEGPSCFLYANNSPYQIGKEKHHILKHFPKAIFVPFETSSHFIHKVFPDQFVKTVVKFIKQNEKTQ